jgi:hypothetical protein
MTTRTFQTLKDLTKGLCGVTRFANDEDAVIASFINRRLYNAYRRSDYWPRYLVLGQARAVVAGAIPFTQVTLTAIDTFLRIYDAAPYVSTAAREYNFNVTSSGAIPVGDVDSSVTAYYVDYKRVFDGPYSDSNSEVPNEFFEYAAHGAYADFLRYDKQTDKALVADQEAEVLLNLELSSVMIQRTAQKAGMRITTHATTQAR